MQDKIDRGIKRITLGNTLGNKMGRDGLAGRDTNCTGKLRANLSGFAQRAVQLIQIRSRRAASCCPASVSTTSRVVLSNRRTPVCPSSSFTLWLTADWLKPMISPARLKLLA